MWTKHKKIVLVIPRPILLPDTIEEMSLKTRPQNVFLFFIFILNYLVLKFLEDLSHTRHI